MARSPKTASTTATAITATLILFIASASSPSIRRLDIGDVGGRRVRLVGDADLLAGLHLPDDVLRRLGSVGLKVVDVAVVEREGATIGIDRLDRADAVVGVGGADPKTQDRGGGEDSGELHGPTAAVTSRSGGGCRTHRGSPYVEGSSRTHCTPVLPSAALEILTATAGLCANRPSRDGGEAGRRKDHVSSWHTGASRLRRAELLASQIPDDLVVAPLPAAVGRAHLGALAQDLPGSLLAQLVDVGVRLVQLLLVG